MLPAAPFVIPMSVTVVYLLYKYWRSGGRTELSEVVYGNRDYQPPPFPHPPPSDHPDPAFILDMIQKLDPAVLDQIRKLLDDIRKLNPAGVDDDPAVLDQIQKMFLKEEENETTCSGSDGGRGGGGGGGGGDKKSVNGGGGGNSVTLPPPSDHHPAPSDHPAVLEQIQKLDLSVPDEIRKLDPAVVDDDQEFEAVLEKIRKMYLKEEEKEGNDKSNERESDESNSGSSGGGGRGEGPKKNENGGGGGSKKYTHPMRAGDCRKYIKNGTCQHGENCKFNHPPLHPRKNNQVSKDKVDNKNISKDKGKEKQESADKPGRTESKVSKDKGKEKQESAERTGRTESKVSKDKVDNKNVSKDKGKGKQEPAEKPGRTESKNNFRSGGSKHGKAGSFNHTVYNRGEPSVAPLLNFLGLPIRPGEKVCEYYIKHASCMHGINCRFDHPDPTVAEEPVPPSGYGIGRPASSKVTSSSMAAPGSAPTSFNDTPFYEPMRIPPSQGIPSQNTEWTGYQGKKNCPYFMRTGSCKYASNCRFNHPDPTAAGEPGHRSGYGTGGPASLPGASSSMALGSAPTSLNDTPLYEPMRIPPSQGIPFQNTEWTGYQAPPSERSLPLPPPHFMNNSRSKTKAFEQYPKQKRVENCQSKSKFKHHHPKNQTAVSPQRALSDKGLPLRPGQIICPQYSCYGVCNLGLACKFDHPSSSTFSL